MEKLLYVLLLVFFCLWSAGCEMRSETLENNSSNQMPISFIDERNEQCVPTFLDMSASKEIILALSVNDHTLPLRASSSFLFAQCEQYILRYDIKSNKIDRIVDLGQTYEGWSFKTSYSSNGRYAISNTFDPQNTNPILSGKNYFLIDLEMYTSQLLATSYNEKIASDATTLIPQESRMDYYNLSFEETGIKSSLLRDSAFIKEIDRNFEHISYDIIDSNRVGLLIPTIPGSEKVLGDYRFIILDLQSDSIVQELCLAPK